MRVCVEHSGLLKRGTTYELVESKDCVFCIAEQNILDKYDALEWDHQ
jgi:hypothetical protein